MTSAIHVTAQTKGFRQMRDFYAWCREMRIPIVQCEVHVWHFEATTISMKGSRQMLDLYTELAQTKGRNAKQVTIRTALLMRETDYTLAALYHGGLRRSWQVFVRESIYGDTGDD